MATKLLFAILQQSLIKQIKLDKWGVASGKKVEVMLQVPRRKHNRFKSNANNILEYFPLIIQNCYTLQSQSKDLVGLRSSKIKG